MGRSAAELFSPLAAVVLVAFHSSLSFICVALTTSRPGNLEELKAGTSAWSGRSSAPVKVQQQDHRPH